MKYDDRDEYDEYYDDYDAYDEYEEPQPYYLNTRDLVFFCLAFMTPAAAAIVYGKAQIEAHGSLAGSYIIAFVLSLLTILSYRRLGRAMGDEGSVLSYTGFGIHFRAGYYTGWTALLFYIMAACSFFMIGADAAARLIEPVPYVFWIILIGLVSGIIVILGQRISSLAVTVIVLGVVGITAIYILVCFIAAGRGAAPADVSSITAFKGTGANIGTVMSGAAIACLSFLGFDSITTLSSDTENPRRSIGKAMGVACAAAAVLFIFQTLASATIIPDFTRLSPPSAIFDIAEVVGGPTMQNLISLSTVLASFGVGIAAITAASRMLRILLDEFSMNTRGAHSSGGGLLSEILPQTGTPPEHVLICLAAAIAIAFIIPGRDFLFAFDLARFAGMICFMLVNAAALIFFWFKRHDPIYVRSIFIPAAGFLASLWIWINIEPSSFGVGVIFALVGVIIIAVSFLYDRLVLGIGPESEPDDVDAV